MIAATLTVAGALALGLVELARLRYRRARIAARLHTLEARR